LSDALVELDIRQLAETNGENQWGGLRRPISGFWLKRLPYWLGGINVNRIREDLRPKVLQYQLELADYSWDIVRTEIMPTDILAEMDATLPPAQQEYHQLMDEAVALKKSIHQQGEQLQSLEARIGGLEARMVGTDFINSAQQRKYLEMVNILGEVLKKKKAGNQAIVHNEIKRQFRVPSYQLIGESDFPAVVKFLTGWFEKVSPPGTRLPFAFTREEQGRLL